MKLSRVWPLTMQQGELFDVVRRFLCDSTRATLVVAAQRYMQRDVEKSLVFFLSDFTHPHYTRILYSTKGPVQTERASYGLEQQLTEYQLEVRTPTARQYIQTRMQIAEPPQCTHPDFEFVQYRVLFKQRETQDMVDAGHYQLAIYDHLNLSEFRLLMSQRNATRKRVLVMYIGGEMGDNDDYRASVWEARASPSKDPTVHYYEMQYRQHDQTASV